MNTHTHMYLYRDASVHTHTYIHIYIYIHFLGDGSQTASTSPVCQLIPAHAATRHGGVRACSIERPAMSSFFFAVALGPRGRR